MTITTLEPVGCEEKHAIETSQEERIPLSAIPKLAWVGATLFIANLVIGIGMLITPSLETDPYGREVRAYDATSSKISPFTQVVDMSRRKVKQAAKAHPVTFVEAPAEEDSFAYVQAGTDQLDLPRTTTSSRSYQQLDMPVRTERALYRPNDQSMSVHSLSAPADAAPRRATERPKTFVVIN